MLNTEEVLGVMQAVQLPSMVETDILMVRTGITNTHGWRFLDLLYDVTKGYRVPGRIVAPQTLGVEKPWSIDC